MRFFEGVKSEYGKVTWPNWTKVKDASLLVLAISLGVALYLGAFDLVVNKLLTLLQKGFGG